MRIVSGYLKGRRFSPPKQFNARPTTDTAKESLFNILNNSVDFEQLKVLDLFSGTGSISFEFASRGCTDVTSVELNFQHFKFIIKCIEELDLKSSIHCIKGDSFKFLTKSQDSFDLIFADPPYDMKEGDQIPDLVFQSTILKPSGLLILEHSDKNSFATHPNFKEVRDYGKVNFSFFQHLLIK